MKLEDLLLEETHIIKIDHFYNINHDIQARFLETCIPLEAMIRILAAIQFEYEELFDEDSISEEQIIRILEAHYKVKDVTQAYRKYLPQTKLKYKTDWEITNEFCIEREDGSPFFINQIDLYSAREAHCGPEYKKLIEWAMGLTEGRPSFSQ